MSQSLHLLVADARFPSSDPAHSGGVEAACALGRVRDPASLRSFLYGRLWTAGAASAFAAAAVCYRASAPKVPVSLWKNAEAEIEARIASAEAREASRKQGGHLLEMAMTIVESPVFESLRAASSVFDHQPHYPVALGAVAAVANLTPEEAAEAAAYASVAGPAFAAQQILGLDEETVRTLGLEMAPQIMRLAADAAAVCSRPLSHMPCFAAPMLDFLAEEHVRLRDKAFAS